MQSDQVTIFNHWSSDPRKDGEESQWTIQSYKYSVVRYTI